MAKEHHCPNCGPQPCNASTSRIHTCGACAAVWDEMITDAKPSPAAGPAAAAPAAPAGAPKPAAAAPVPPKPAPATPATPVAQAAPTPRPAPAQASPPSGPVPIASAATERPGPGSKRLSDLVAGARVSRCPSCITEPLNHPSDFREVQGRIVFIDSQSYRGHMWFADTGEAYRPPTVPTPSEAKAAA